MPRWWKILSRSYSIKGTHWFKNVMIRRIRWYYKRSRLRTPKIPRIKMRAHPRVARAARLRAHRLKLLKIRAARKRAHQMRLRQIRLRKIRQRRIAHLKKLKLRARQARIR